MAPVVLLGPQGGSPDVGKVLAELGVHAKVGLVRAGYQEREADDAETVTAIGVPVVNLKLHARSVEVFRDDTDFATAYTTRQQRLRHMQAFYRVRLDKIEDAAKTISVRHVPPELLEQEERVSIDQLRHIDSEHIERCNDVRKAFSKEWPYASRPVVKRHREQLREELAGCDALVIAGGHVASLLNRLALFDIMTLAAGKPIIAWSAGAMVLTERIVLFHDYPPYGSDIAQVLDAGFALAQGLVVLPDMRRRVNLEARAGIQRFARRMDPLTCIGLDAGSRAYFENGVIVRATKAVRLTANGNADHDWDGSPSRQSTAVLRGVPL